MKHILNNSNVQIVLLRDTVSMLVNKACFLPSRQLQSRKEDKYTDKRKEITNKMPQSPAHFSIY